MNRFFEDANERRARGRDGDTIESVDWYPAADVYDTESAYLIAVDLPGVERSALEIDLDDEKLVIRGNRTIDSRVESGKDQATRPHGRFRKSFAVPGNVAQDGIQAEYRNGVLEVTLPKRSEPRGQRIQIKVQ
jgi:HSP20 family protein